MFGPEARFRFAVPAGAGDLLFTLEGRPGAEPGRRIDLSANGTPIGTLDHAGNAEASHAFLVRRALLAGPTPLEITLLVADPPKLRNSVAARQFTYFIRSLTLSLEQDERGSVSSGTALSSAVGG